MRPHSMISERVVQECGLHPTGFGNSYHAQGATLRVPKFSVNIVLPNDVHVVGIPVMQGAFNSGFDVIIGMEIITQGDFAVTNRRGRTKFSFRLPSEADIDFVREDAPRHVMKAKRSTTPRRRGKRRRK